MNMTSSDRFLRTISDYQQQLQVHPVPLSDYCKTHHVDYRGIRNWMRNNNVRVRELKKSNQMNIESNPDTSDTSAKEDIGLYPLSFQDTTVEKPSLRNKSFPCIKGVNITFPDGVIVSIREISRKDLTEFIVSYK